MLYEHIFAMSPLCNFPRFSKWTWYINYFETSSFFIVVIVQLSRFAVTSSSTNDIGSIFSTCFVSLLAGISSLINVIGNLIGNCEDIFGVRLPGAVWAEWITCVPLLFYIVLATDTKIRLCRTDILIISLIIFVFISAMSLQFSKSYSFSVFLLVISNIAFFTGYVLFYSEIFLNHRNHILLQNQPTVDEGSSLLLQKIKNRLAICLLTLLPLFPLVYLLAVFGVINHDITYLLFVILNVHTKLIFTTIITNTHLHATSEIRRTHTSAATIRCAADNAAQESRNLFLRYIMHEVRVPLNSITMGLGFLEHCPSLDDDAQEALLMMNGATGCMKKTLDDMLTIQSIEEGVMDIKYFTFSLTTLTTRIKDSLQPALEDKQLSLIINIQPTVPKLLVGDRILVEHILASLINNACKYSDSHSTVTLTISSTFTTTRRTSITKNFSNFIGNSIAFKGKKKLLPQLFPRNCSVSSFDNNTVELARQPSSSPNPNPLLKNNNNNNSNNNINNNNNRHNNSNKHLRRDFSHSSGTSKKVSITFAVSDTGCGIAESEIPTLFLPYSQIYPHEIHHHHHHHNNNIQNHHGIGSGGSTGAGSGMGLMMCKQLVDRLDGTITCQSTVGIGSIFTVTLPFNISDETEEEEVQRDLEEFEEKKQSLDILLVENDITTNNFTERMNHNSNNNNFKNKKGMTSPSNQTMKISPTINNYKRTKSGNNVLSLSEFHVENNNVEVVECKNNSSRSSSSGNNNSNNNSNSKRATIRYSGLFFDEEDGLQEIVHGISNSAHSRLKADKNNSNIEFTTTTTNNTASHNNSSNNNTQLLDKSSAQQRSLKNIKTFSSRNTMDYNNSNNNNHHNINDCNDDNDNNNSENDNDTIVYYLHHVLIIDDVLSNRRILAMLLRRQCIDSTMAVNGLEGVEVVLSGQQTFDLIFMDNSMPIMTGIEATKRLRASGYSNLIIGVTGNAMEKDVEEFIAAGADSVILKPITAPQINQIIRYSQKFGFQHDITRKIIFLDDSSYCVNL